MVQAKCSTNQLSGTTRPDTLGPSVGTDLIPRSWPPATGGYEIRHHMRIGGAAKTVFRFLIDADRMQSWLALNVRADPRPGGAFRLADLNGLWVEGLYLKVSPYRRIAFTWGGIEGLKIGESTVEFSLQSDTTGTVLRLRHFNLSKPALEMHRLGWSNWGLPQLKAAAEGEQPRGTYLGHIADLREHGAYRRRGPIEN